MRPDHQLTVRQSVAPLGRQLEIVGQAVPAAGQELLLVTGAGFGGTAVEEPQPANDWFAPALWQAERNAWDASGGFGWKGRRIQGLEAWRRASGGGEGSTHD